MATVLYNQKFIGGEGHQLTVIIYSHNREANVPVSTLYNIV